MLGTITPPGGKVHLTAILPTDKPKVRNQCKMKKATKPCCDHIMQPGYRITIMCEYVNNIEYHNGRKNKLWQSWLESGLENPNVTVHHLADIVKYPDIKYKALLNIGIYVLEKTPDLAQFLKLSTNSHHHELIWYHTKLVIV